MVHAVVPHIKTLPNDGEVITYIKSSETSGFILSMGWFFIIGSHPQDSVGRRCRDPMGAAGFLN